MVIHALMKRESLYLVAVGRSSACKHSGGMRSYIERLLGKDTESRQVWNARYNGELMRVLSERNIEENVRVVVSAQEMSADAEPCLLKCTCASHQADGDTWDLRPDRTKGLETAVVH